MAYELATAFVRVGAKTSGLSTGLNAAKNIIIGSLRNIASTAATLGGLVGGVGLGAAVKIAGDAEEMQSMFKSVFQEGSSEAEKFATDMALKLGRSVNDVMGQMAGFQDTFVPLGFARDKAAELSKQLATVTADLASFKNKNDSDVAKTLTSALTGEREALKGLGIVIQEVDVNNELMRMGMKNATGDALKQAKAQATLNLIVKGSADAQGDAAKTAGSFTNRMRGLTGAIKDTLGIIGSAFLPALANIAKVASDALRSIGPRIQAVASDFAKWGQAISQNWQLTWDIVKNSTQLAVESIKAAFSQIPERVAFLQGRTARTVIDSFTSIAETIRGVMGRAFEFLEAKWRQTVENMSAWWEGRKARIFEMPDLVSSDLTDKIKSVGKAFAAGFEGKSFLGDVFEASPEMNRLLDKNKELLGRLKSHRDAIGTDGGVPVAAKKPKLDVGQINVAKWEIPKGMFGLAEINDAIQRSMLESIDPQEKANELINQGNGFLAKAVGQLQHIVANTKPVKASVATA